MSLTPDSQYPFSRWLHSRRKSGAFRLQGPLSGPAEGGWTDVRVRGSRLPTVFPPATKVSLGLRRCIRGTNPRPSRKLVTQTLHPTHRRCHFDTLFSASFLKINFFILVLDYSRVGRVVQRVPPHPSPFLPVTSTFCLYAAFVTSNAPSFTHRYEPK